MPHRPTPAIENDPLFLAAATWLASGVVLLGLTPLPLHTAGLGWSPAFWLLVAPALSCIVRAWLRPRLVVLPERRVAQRQIGVPKQVHHRPRGAVCAWTPQRKAA